MAEIKTKCKKSLHSGHRERMLKKYIRLGADAFSPHEILEMLLFHSIPRRNTNETAHQLIADFGSIYDALRSKCIRMTETAGIGEKSASLLSLANDTVRCAELEHSAKVPLDTAFRQCRYLHAWYRNKGRGYVMAMLLDANKMLIETVTLASGRRFRPESYPPLILELAQSVKAEHVIISHNHFDNSTEPSLEDLYLTNLIGSALQKNDINLLEHYIVTEFDCIPTCIYLK